jgi:hypothetical protein
MTHHHHQRGEPHLSPPIGPSLLRLAASKRLAVAGALIVLIWTAYSWTTR